MWRTTAFEPQTPVESNENQLVLLENIYLRFSQTSEHPTLRFTHFVTRLLYVIDVVATRLSDYD